jgi:branched-chain amino acid transport system substrate-binding protein
VASADFLRVGGKAVEGSFFPQSPVVVAEQLPDGYPTKPLALKYITAYEAKFGPRTVFAAVAWDAMKILEATIPTALKSAKPGTEKFREALRTAIENLKGFQAATAVFTMSPTDHTGVDQLGMSLIKIENGGWTLVDSTPF